MANVWQSTDEYDFFGLGRVLRGDRRGANNAARAVGNHLWKYRLSHQVHALDVDRHEPVPLMLLHLQKRLHDQSAGVIEKRIRRVKLSQPPLVIASWT